MQTQRGRLGVIGGSGLYAIEGLVNVEEVMPQTPFGAPSDAIVTGMLGEQPVAFLPRHGRGHRISPTEVPSRANIYVLKELGVEWIISVSAVGSLREDYAPLDLVVPDQIFDRTRSRANSFFEDGVVAHISFADPFCPHLSERLWTPWRAARGLADGLGGGTHLQPQAQSSNVRLFGAGGDPGENTISGTHRPVLA
jgi:5'-methylthioadenosine phosphorylase